MTHPEMKEFIRNHFEGFVNRKNLRISEVNFPGLWIAERMCRGECRKDRRVRSNASGPRWKKFPTFR
jgi:hypothetical protein